MFAIALIANGGFRSPPARRYAVLPHDVMITLFRWCFCSLWQRCGSARRSGATSEGSRLMGVKLPSSRSVS
jgi:hypothetical protein